MARGQRENITFEASVTTKPFCKAMCTSSFLAIGDGTIMDKDNFTLKPGLGLQKTYTMQIDEFGTGQKLYRFDMMCHSMRTFFCHTDEETTTRQILVAVDYNLTEEEDALKEDLKGQTGQLKNQLGRLKGEQYSFNKAFIELNSFADLSELDKKLNDFNSNLDVAYETLEEAREIWDKQDYLSLDNHVKKLKTEMDQSEREAKDINTSLSVAVDVYNGLLKKLTRAQKQLIELKSEPLTDEVLLLEIDRNVIDFNKALLLFGQKKSLNEKTKNTDDLVGGIDSLYKLARQDTKREALKHYLEADIAYDSICVAIGECYNHPTITERANQKIDGLEDACNYVNELKEVYNKLNDSIYASFIDEDYPDTGEFWDNISALAFNIKNNITYEYLNQIPDNLTNSAIIQELLVYSSQIPVTGFTEYNLSPAIALELIEKQPQGCVFLNYTISSVNEINFNEVKIEEIIPVDLEIEFKEPLSKCCVFNQCRACCISQECRDDPKNFPVVFLHGHAVNKDVSAEYSLEGFNDIQEQLGEDGYLSAGAITLYTEQNVPYGIWGKARVPMTIRASYYFDFFKEPENYVVVQTKSENIDTYAIRLKYLIDTIQYKTGKPKVNIIAFSMGGLVTRRYIQIFGTDDVSKVILIGTPNKGIVGSISDYCPITGEKLECRDMNADSLFMKKLNSGPLPDLMIYNIVGTGCKMGNDIGDGAVLTDHALLEGAKNFIINGTCRSTVKPLHLELRELSLYPEVYQTIKGALEEQK